MGSVVLAPITVLRLDSLLFEELVSFKVFWLISVSLRHIIFSIIPNTILFQIVARILLDPDLSRSLLIRLVPVPKISAPVNFTGPLDGNVLWRESITSLLIASFFSSGNLGSKMTRNPVTSVIACQNCSAVFMNAKKDKLIEAIADTTRKYVENNNSNNSNRRQQREESESHLQMK